jgi:hypothetical protein
MLQRLDGSQVNFRMTQAPTLGDEVMIEILLQGIDITAGQQGAPHTPQIMRPAPLGGGNVPRAHVVDADEEQHHLGPQLDDVILHEDDMP